MKLIFKYGTMGAGKSLQLLAVAHNFQERNIPFVILKSFIDTRSGSDKVFSRALGEKDCVTINRADNIFDIIKSYIDTNYEGLKWILVDEAQFLSTEQVDQLGAIVDILNINVICYGLRTDFQTKLFPASKRLFEIADTIEEIKSSCFCNRKTIFNARIDNTGKIITNGHQIEVGGDDRYISLCRKCYNTKTQNPYYL